LFRSRASGSAVSPEGDGIVTIAFDREAGSTEEAIRSALQTIHQAGYAAKSVILEPASFQV
jgi:hypothetical protein